MIHFVKIPWDQYLNLYVVVILSCIQSTIYRNINQFFKICPSPEVHQLISFGQFLLHL